MRRSRPAIIRFLEKITVNPDRIFNDTACWEWIGNIDTKTGYGGTFRTGSDKQEKPHRFAYLYFVGDIPSEHEIHHLCYNRRCVSPLHLEPRTHFENSMDKNSAMYQKSTKPNCAKGHPLVGDNLYYTNRGLRRCRTCARESVRQYTNDNLEKMRTYFREKARERRARLRESGQGVTQEP